jgi:5-methyltetrahydrofolate--homocysteine methyltransferase
VPDFLSALKHRVLVFDSAMGTNVQKHNLTAEDLLGKEGCNELLVLSRPDVIRSPGGIESLGLIGVK